LTSVPASDLVVIAIAVDDPALSERLAGLLADVPGIRLAADGEASDARLVAPESPTNAAMPSLC